jgi:hypothetical protein
MHKNSSDRPSVVSNSGTSKDPVAFFLIGDVFQLATQENTLLECGISVGRLDIYPGVYNVEDFKTALAVIWHEKLDGWNLYQAEFIKHSICTEAEFNSARLLKTGS